MTRTTDDVDGGPRPEMSDHRPAAREAELEERVRKLETALAERPALEGTEDAVADRVLARLSTASGESRSDRVLVLASAPEVKPQPPKGAVFHLPPPPPDPSRKTWFVSQLVAEFRLALRMYLDPRYRISRTTQFALPGIVFLLALNYFLFTSSFSIPVLSPILDRLLTVFLAILGYKILMRELTRYREVLEYLARYGQK